MIHPKVVGDRSTLAIMLALHSTGHQILMPFGENCRYDLAVDDGNQLMRVQCKTGRLRDGAVRFNACSNRGHQASASKARRDYAGEIDAFCVYCPDTAGVYLVPIDELPAKTEGALRVAPTRNGQIARTRSAANYLVGEIAVPMAA